MDGLRVLGPCHEEMQRASAMAKVSMDYKKNSASSIECTVDVVNVTMC